MWNYFFGKKKPEPQQEAKPKESLDPDQWVVLDKEEPVNEKDFIKLADSVVFHVEFKPTVAQSVLLEETRVVQEPPKKEERSSVNMEEEKEVQTEESPVDASVTNVPNTEVAVPPRNNVRELMEIPRTSERKIRTLTKRTEKKLQKSRYLEPKNVKAIAFQRQVNSKPLTFGREKKSNKVTRKH